MHLCATLIAFSTCQRCRSDNPGEPSRDTAFVVSVRNATSSLLTVFFAFRKLRSRRLLVPLPDIVDMVDGDRCSDDENAAWFDLGLAAVEMFNGGRPLSTPLAPASGPSFLLPLPPAAPRNGDRSTSPGGVRSGDEDCIPFRIFVRLHANLLADSDRPRLAHAHCAASIERPECIRTDGFGETKEN